MRILLFLTASLLFFSLPLNAQAAKTVSETGTEIGRYAPPIELADLSGNTVTLESLRGQVVLLNFWSTLCPPCTAEMPSMNRLYASLKDRGFQIVSVAIDSTDKPVREYVEKNNIVFPVLLDTEKEVFFDVYAGPSLPATYLINRNGMIVEKFTGLQVWDAPEMKNRVMILLEKSRQ
jgi:peroxiredoxin